MAYRQEIRTQAAGVASHTCVKHEGNECVWLRDGAENLGWFCKTCLNDQIRDNLHAWLYPHLS
jgi:hypothetical protein